MNVCGKQMVTGLSHLEYYYYYFKVKLPALMGPERDCCDANCII